MFIFVVIVFQLCPAVDEDLGGLCLHLGMYGISRAIAVRIVDHLYTGVLKFTIPQVQ